ncbi:diacylglycerol/polyprenol kinase family protein [Sanyastnella coralliicola]|uniref:diacylglycerol/polyprenol kinase family protein n=1 Tax=Sanyastnella coralliicola TaxID=3069118 RepID=UPI0027B8984D|nr:hypothetical protein [Longitalea sp. SCSIO 12813]
MSTDLIHCLLLSGAFLTLFLVGEIMYHRFQVRVELTRKWSHFGTGILSLLFPILLSSHWYVLFLCSSFALLLLTSLRFNFLKSINAIERKSHGSLLYPLAVYLCFFAFEYKEVQYAYFYIPILTLAISDPLAALVGKRFGKTKYHLWGHEKSYLGSLAFFLSACCIAAIGIAQMNLALTSMIMITLLFALVTTIVEAMSGNGWDNLTIPLSGLLILLIL